MLVIGAGPTGLGAATRLHQHGKQDWLMVDQVGCTETCIAAVDFQKHIFITHAGAS